MESLATQNQNSRAAFGIFKRNSDVIKAQAELTRVGFHTDSVEVMFPPTRGPQDFPQRQRTMLLDGAMIGAGLGILGAMVVILVVGTGAIDLPVLQIIDSLPKQIFLSIALLFGGLFFGGIAGALVGIGTPEEAGARYGDYVDSGGILMSVHVKDIDEVRRAKDALDQSGAGDISILGEDQGWQKVYDRVSNMR
jgi:hypothetical protein